MWGCWPAALENGGQTLGPIIYGLAFTNGYRMGILLVGGALTELLTLFIAANV